MIDVFSHHWLAGHHSKHSITSHALTYSIFYIYVLSPAGCLASSHHSIPSSHHSASQLTAIIAVKGQEGHHPPSIFFFLALLAYATCTRKPHTHTQTYIHTYTQTYMHYIHTYTHSHIHAHKHAHIHTYIHRCMHTYILT